MSISPHWRGHMPTGEAGRRSKIDYSGVDVGVQQRKMVKLLEDYVKWDTDLMTPLCTRSLCMRPRHGTGKCVAPNG